MASLDYMKIDLETILNKAGAPEDVRKSHPFHLSVAVVAKFKEACEKADISNARVLEVFMVQFAEYVNKKKK